MKIKWRTYKGTAGDLQTLLMGEYKGHEESRLYFDFSPFDISLRLAKRRIERFFKILFGEIK